MLVLGVISLLKMPVDLFPDVTFPIVAIQITYPGASPAPSFLVFASSVAM
jgi:multidrug efflux pump subunit AcrB